MIFVKKSILHGSPSLTPYLITAMSLRAEQLSQAIAELARRIEKSHAKASSIHGGRKCGKNFWCGGYCERARDLREVKQQQECELHHALALMAAERLALAGVLPSDVLRMIVEHAS